MICIALKYSKARKEVVSDDELPIDVQENVKSIVSNDIDFLHYFCEIYQIHYYIAFSEGRVSIDDLLVSLKIKYKLEKENKQMNKPTKGHGFIRKSKQFSTVCGIALGGAVLMGTPVFADETLPPVETTQPIATSVVETTTAPVLEATIETTTSVPVTSTDTASVATTLSETTAVPVALSENAVQTETATPTEVASNSTATIDVTSERNDGYNSNTTIKTELTASAKARDTVTYTSQNLSLAGLNGLDVTIADGTIIGKVSASNTSSPADQQTAGATGLTASANSSKVVVTFNKNVEGLDSVTYTLKLIGQSQAVLSSKGYDMTASISTSGKEIVSKNVHIGAVPKENLNDTYAYLSKTASVQNVSQDGTVNGNLVFGIYTSSEEPMNIGDTTTLKLDAKSPLIFDTTAGNTAVGSRQTLKPSRVFDGSNVDANNIIVVDKTNPVFEVVSASEDTIVVKLVEGNIAKDGRYGYLVFKNQVSDPTAFDMNSKLVKSVQYSSTTTTGSGSQMLTQTPDLPIIGSLADGNAIRVYGNVVEINQLEDGTVLSKADVTSGNVVVGTAYDTTEQASQIKGNDGKLYDLVSVGDNSKGLVVRGTTTVVNIYKLHTETKKVKTGEVFGTVKLIKVDDTGKVLKPAQTVTDEAKVLVAEEYTTYVMSGDVILSETKEVVPTGTKYDATNLKEEVIELEGKTYKIFSEKSEIDKLTGKVIEGDILITLVYKEEVKPLEAPTPEEPTAPTPEAPKEDVPPTPQAPVVEQAVLPKTGTKNSVVATIAGAILLVLTLGLVGYKRKEEK